jgi:hypothetical protein
VGALYAFGNWREKALYVRRPALDRGHPMQEERPSSSKKSVRISIGYRLFLSPFAAAIGSGACDTGDH